MDIGLNQIDEEEEDDSEIVTDKSFDENVKDGEMISKKRKNSKKN
jgi:hypothetical protein